MNTIVPKLKEKHIIWSKGTSISYRSADLKRQSLLTLFQLVIHYNQKGHRDHEKVEDEADLTQLTNGRATQLLHHRLVGVLTTDGGGITQNDQATDQEHERDLRTETHDCNT